jgi:hypothetical protein
MRRPAPKLTLVERVQDFPEAAPKAPGFRGHECATGHQCSRVAQSCPVAFPARVPVRGGLWSATGPKDFLVGTEDGHPRESVRWQ